MGKTLKRPVDEKRPVDAVVYLRAQWMLRDLNMNDFNKAISDILEHERKTNNGN